MDKYIRKIITALKNHPKPIQGEKNKKTRDIIVAITYEARLP